MAIGAGSHFKKGGWYQVCAAPDSKYKGENRFDLLTEPDKDRYRHQRRAIGPAYSIAGIEKHDALVSSYIDTFTDRLHSFDSKFVDLQTWTHIFSLDVLANLTLSKNMDYTAQGHDDHNMKGSEKHWAYFTVVGLFPWLVELTQTFPKLYNYTTPIVAMAFGLPLPTALSIFRFAVPNVLDRLKALDSTSTVKMPMDRPGLVLSHVDDMSSTKLPSENVTDSDADKDLLASLMRLHADKQTTFHPAWVLGMAMTNFGAGHDTMTITLSGMLYCIASHSNVQARLVHELKENRITRASSYTDIVTSVPYILAVLKESLRLYPNIGFMLPRIVPPSGISVGPHYIPPGTTVASSMYATHHDPATYADPEAFRPERWMPDGTAQKKEEIHRMEGVWLGFGGGSHSCPGQHLARFCVVKGVARVLGEFEVGVEGEPRVRGWFSAHMSGVRVMFRPRE
jgi:hypothetical protein